MKRSTRRRLAALLVILVAVGCGPHRHSIDPTPIPSDDGPYTLPDLVRYNYRWSTDPGIDLLSGPATAVRAYIESYYIATDAHSTKAGYPGFERAIEHLVFDPPRRRDINDRTDYHPDPIVGTYYGHLLSMTPTDTGFDVLVCEGMYSVMYTREDGTYGNFGARIPNAAIITLAPGPDGATHDSHNTEGPSRAPHSDMFGGWTVTRHVFSSYDFDYHLACEGKFPDPPENRPRRLNEVFTVPYPTLPPYPGWPERAE